ncbi:putative membrane protein YedE/YeeE [Peteryoungia aggregata LMG 23059]|uniref:Membrane protein YedE/YeeE n=1 Tax=Peteryoungia aggregata LMG 23059 TaxID=1368425 RepID=A0ABU0GBL5_9HYPH|nr:YeeE/YedE family protein [Peteryoungia aggregata]MDQ0422744.1 putative membrane protein YedE/YeeE [Peteryoungia aggregata LMG 23059]
MTEFTPLMSFAGGLLIGLSALLLMLTWGRIAGMTAIIGGILPPLGRDWSWKAAFLAGAILAPAALSMAGHTVEYAVPVSTTALIVGGLIAGIGVTFGSGCTSGHGICGMARLSRRSITATATFMAFAVATVFLIRHVFEVTI